MKLRQFNPLSDNMLRPARHLLFYNFTSQQDSVAT